MALSRFLAYNQPEIGDDEIRAVTRVLESRWLTRGAVTEEFEAALTDWLTVGEVVAVSSCTAALHLALLLHNIGPGDEVITTPMTFVSSVNAIVATGARPILVDIDGLTGNIDISLVEQQITSKTRAVLAVHYGGHPLDMDRLNAVRDRHGLVVIEDAAHALGSAYQGRPVGSFGNMAAFSFYATKNVTTAEGGALIVNDATMAEKARTMALHGLSRPAWNRYGSTGSWQYDVAMLGFKYNMTDLAAAIGLAQMAKLPAMQSRRAALAKRYEMALRNLPLRLPSAQAPFEHAWHLYPVHLDERQTPLTRDEVIDQLRQTGIGTSVHFIPIYRFTYYRERFGWDAAPYPETEKFFQGEISLPLYPSMSDADVDRVAQALGDILSPRA